MGNQPLVQGWLDGQHAFGAGRAGAETDSDRKRAEAGQQGISQRHVDLSLFFYDVDGHGYDRKIEQAIAVCRYGELESLSRAGEQFHPVPLAGLKFLHGEPANGVGEEQFRRRIRIVEVSDASGDESERLFAVALQAAKGADEGGAADLDGVTRAIGRA